MKKEIIYIQTWANSTAKSWDDVMATKHEVYNAGETAQLIANVTGCPVRMTRPMDGVKIGSLNGSYFNPQGQTLYSPTVQY